MSKLFEDWTWNRKLPAPFDDVAISQRTKVHLSRYNTASTKTATLHSATLSAILQYMELFENPESEDLGAMGSQKGEYLVAEYPSRSKELHAAVFIKPTGKFLAGRFDDVSQPPKPYIL